ncbi:MAG TPA: LysM peptidoglycan-binding domain-containing protein [Phycisphaerae bacterium]|nr:LysM peptidoglycan-binding domain-containing protein [Phycisphaerae bacterium]
MTRETKIGLLVGMGFIVLFGIILSEAGSRRRAMLTPQYAATGTLSDPAPRTNLAVLIQDSSALVAEADQAFGATADQTVLARRPVPDTSAPRQLAASSSGRPAPKPTIEHGPPPGSETVPVLEAAPEVKQPEPTLDEPIIPPAQPASAVSIYVVKENDNLTKIARQVLGTASPEAIQAIYEANRENLKNINHLCVGQQLRIPKSLDTASQARRAPSKPAGNGLANRSESAYRSYQVRQKDTWSSIARHELGDRARWRELYELNRGKFPNPNRIRPGVRIKLPADASG